MATPTSGKRLSSTVSMVESDWELYMKKEKSISLYPWELYLTFRNAKIVTVEPVIFLYSFGMYIYLSFYQQYFFNRYGLDELKDTDFNNTSMVCLTSSEIDEYTGVNGTYKIVEHHSSNLFIYCNLANKIISIIISMIMGPLSDRYGRRPVIITVSIGAVIQGLCTLFVVHFNLNVLFFIPIAGIAGFFGDFTAIMMGSFSYISDVSSKKWRATRIGLGQTMLFLAGLLSQGLGGLWFQKLNCNFTYPLILYIACHSSTILYTLFLLPESLTKDERKIMRSGKLNGVKALTRGAMIFLCKIQEYSPWILWIGLSSVMIMMVNMAGLFSVVVFFFKAIDWEPDRIGIYQAISHASHAVVLISVLPILVALKLPDPLIVLIGVIVSYSMTFLMGLSKITYQFFIAASFQGLEAVMVPTLNGMMSKVVSAADQGALFSVIASGEAFSSLVAGIIYPIIFTVTLDHEESPGTIFFVMATLGVVPAFLMSILLLSWCMKKYQARHSINNGSSEVIEKTPFLPPNKRTDAANEDISIND